MGSQPLLRIELLTLSCISVCLISSILASSIPDILREDGYPDVQAFMATYREAEAVVEQYNRDLAEWERQVKQKSRPPRPPEKESVRNRLRQLQEQGRQQKPRKKSFDRGSR